MTAPPDESLRVLVFRVGSVRYGADAGQVASVGAGADSRCLWNPLDGPGGAPLPPGGRPTLRIRGDQGRMVEMAVDALEDILELGLAELRPLPALVAARVRDWGLWGVAVREPAPVFLVDLRRLAGKARDFAEPGPASI